jgi:hypothetical protein
MRVLPVVSEVKAGAFENDSRATGQLTRRLLSADGTRKLGGGFAHFREALEKVTFGATILVSRHLDET